MLQDEETLIPNQGCHTSQNCRSVYCLVVLGKILCFDQMCIDYLGDGQNSVVQCPSWVGWGPWAVTQNLDTFIAHSRYTLQRWRLASDQGLGLGWDKAVIKEI